MWLSDLVRAIFSLFAPGRSGPNNASIPAQTPVHQDVHTGPGGTIQPGKADTAPAAPEPAPKAPEVPIAPVVPVPVALADLSTPSAFIAAIAPAAQACAERTGVPASVTVAQAALESSWGKRAPGMNLFGIKADASWRGPVMSQITHEVVNGETVTITARFRAYSDWQGSIDDHAAFLTGNPRYRPAFAFKDGPNFARAIAKAGYATDPLYADKLIAIMSTRGLGALDHPEA
ncbi:glycoside hydrolase family 73 protein [Burkholderia cenocepacia]|uniref:glycoside hydrolase family 73 protein n=1 Tax=Burkholderia cenocepacia TaxID=95486 RepID=UPI00222EC57E|nr:glucosaminidase domain-containing protein [Burkholderia cenocepacia]MCW3678208.1 glucosaminidase domain-containing protein [Burkholderia cenocepacia]